MASRLRIDMTQTHRAWRGRARYARAVLHAAAAAEGAKGAVSVLLGDDAALRALNKRWRGKDKPTNVLSFPATPGPERLLGDLALAAETVAAEAAAQGKSFETHMAHLLTHGLLHLLGYDHETDSDAERMEARERRILAGLGLADPYARQDRPPERQ